MADEVKAHVIFHGRVQGVWFRASTRDLARKYDVSGWVRNLPDGTVEAVFEGPVEVVERVITMCKNFPSPKRVDRAEVDIDDSKGEFSSFKVKY